MSNEFDYTPPPECGHKAYQTESCAHCIYVVMQAEAKMYIHERDHAEAKLEHVTRVLANTQRALGEVLAEREQLKKTIADQEEQMAVMDAIIEDYGGKHGVKWEPLPQVSGDGEGAGAQPGPGNQVGGEDTGDN